MSVPCHEGPPATRGHFCSEPAVAGGGRYYCSLQATWSYRCFFNERFSTIYCLFIDQVADSFNDYLHLLYFWQRHLHIITLIYSLNLIVLIIPEQYFTFVARLNRFYYLDSLLTISLLILLLSFVIPLICRAY